MDIIPSFFSWSALALPLGLLLVAVVAFTIYGINEHRGTGGHRGSWFGVVGGIFTLITMATGFIQLESFGSKRTEAVAAEVADKYGVSLNYAQASRLYYPEVEPSSDFRVYGTTEAEIRTVDGYATQEVSLLWDSGELVLASSTDGENFEYLKRQD